MKLKYLNQIVLVVLLVSNNLFGQFTTSPHIAPQDIIDDIELQMTSKYEGTYVLAIYNIMDSSINEMPYDFSEENYKDPYGTLQGLSLFSCQKYSDTQDSSIVGFYKDGTILWDSGPIIFGNIDPHLFFCKDINRDSKVDIGLRAEKFDHNPNYTDYYLWILSWNGSQGEFINDYDASTRKSKLIPGYFYLLDWEGDGIYEIISEYVFNEDYVIPQIENLPPNYPYVTYGWNGSKYGLWESVYQLKEGDHFPAIWIEPTINCRVINVDSLLHFQYTISNGINSLQDIRSICFYGLPVEKIDITSTYKDSIFSSGGGEYYAWCFIPSDEVKSYSGLIAPGETKNGYWYKGIGLPGIVIAYLDGLTDFEITRLIRDEDESPMNNTVKRKTIGLKAIPQMLDKLVILDTLITYTDNSYSFGWITNEQARDKYDNYFNNAKNYLNQNNNSAAKADLQNVLTDCNADSSTVLSSEAYALLYFNTDYLIKQIPEGESGLPVKLEDSQGNLLQGGSLQYYDRGWKDAIDNGDGTFTVQTEKSTVSLKMNYAGASKQLNNLTVGPDTTVFQTVNAKVQLKDSQGNLLPVPSGDGGTVKYYASGWKDFGTVENGEATKELLPKEYSFRMNYGGASLDKKQDISDNNPVLFSTVNCIVRVTDGSNQPIDNALASYYASDWKEIDNTLNGEINKELLPRNYSFRVNSNGVNKDKQQDISSNNIVEFTFE